MTRDRLIVAASLLGWALGFLFGFGFGRGWF